MHKKAKVALWTACFLSMFLTLAFIVWPSSAESKVETSAQHEQLLRTTPINTGPSFSLAGLDDALRWVHATNERVWNETVAENERLAEQAVAAAPAMASKPKPVVASTGAVRDAIATYFPDNFDSATRVANCESSLDSTAVGGDNYGLFQIAYVHRDDFEQFTGHPWSDIFNPYLNSMYARKMYDSDGSPSWGPWACRWAA